MVMGAETSKDRFAACKQLLDYGFANYAIVSPQWEDAGVPVKLGTADSVKAVPNSQDAVLIDKNQKNQISYQTELEETVKAPVSRGQRLGTLYIRVGEQILREIPLVAEEGVEKLTFLQLWRYVIRKLAGCG